MIHNLTMEISMIKRPFLLLLVLTGLSLTTVTQAGSQPASAEFNGYCSNPEGYGDSIEQRFCEETLLESLSVTDCADAAKLAVELYHQMPTSWKKDIEIRGVQQRGEDIYRVEFAPDAGNYDLYYISQFMDVKVQEDQNSCGAVDIDTTPLN
jgi:hypothetical protein